MSVAALLALSVSGAGAASALAQGPDLTAENFNADVLVPGEEIGTLEIESDCDPNGVSTISWEVTGAATGPYPGTFHETGTMTGGPQEPGESGAPLTVEAEFTIDSPAGQVSGTKTLAEGTAASFLCQEFEITDPFDLGLVWVRQLEASGAMSYEATITPPTGDPFTDQGFGGTSVNWMIVRYGDPDAYSAGESFGASFTSTGPVEGDDDGLSNEVEDTAPNAGDGNNDGVLDSEQAHVASLPNAETGEYLTVVASDGTSLVGVEAQANPSPSDAPSEEFPLGFIGFGLDGVEPGGTATIELIDHAGVGFDTYYKYGPTPDDNSPHWYEFDFDGTTGAEITGGSLLLHFVDGERGDSDIEANGFISDPGGPSTTAERGEGKPRDGDPDAGGGNGNPGGGSAGARCQGARVTIVGTSGPDELLGTEGNDVIRARGGDDEVRGLAGNDLVCTGPGEDHVAAGKGRDNVRGGAGGDSLFGGRGGDLLQGQAGDDTLRGGKGRDHLRGGEGDDDLAAGKGFDSCRGGAGNDASKNCEG